MSFCSHSRSYTNKKTNINIDMKQDYDENTFNGRLRKSRIENNISIQDLASMIGVTKSLVSAYEVGRYFPNIGILNKIGKYFDMDYLCRDGYSNLVWNNECFIENLRSWINSNNFSKYEVAKLLGVSSSTFKYWFEGSVMSMTTYNKIKNNLTKYKLI
ncbi:XRE family transcriptional regulator [Romboutsia maritimum]|uniref:XRE family transcriptional regulator n=1 Tax=Romboutsia maritimum TaxID=2020948 RepID=A0A371IQV2_9FIRM|nr:helix-turn-helix transcriptional regulator [Romboutsia maritimum]RDY22843.1 XRE family transcriptional regulator [Romboutsia maritimum]